MDNIKKKTIDYEKVEVMVNSSLYKKLHGEPGKLVFVDMGEYTASIDAVGDVIVHSNTGVVDFIKIIDDTYKEN